MINSYHNTTNLFGDKLEEYTTKAITQDKAVIEILTEAGTHLTAPEVYALYLARYKPKFEPPIDSIKRSCSTLKKKGILEMVNVMKQGRYGRPNKQYRIK